MMTNGNSSLKPAAANCYSRVQCYCYPSQDNRLNFPRPGMCYNHISAPAFGMAAILFPRWPPQTLPRRIQLYPYCFNSCTDAIWCYTAYLLLPSWIGVDELKNKSHVLYIILKMCNRTWLRTFDSAHFLSSQTDTNTKSFRNLSPSSTP